MGGVRELSESQTPFAGEEGCSVSYDLRVSQEKRLRIEGVEREHPPAWSLVGLGGKPATGRATRDVRNLLGGGVEKKT